MVGGRGKAGVECVGQCGDRGWVLRGIWKRDEGATTCPPHRERQSMKRPQRRPRRSDTVLSQIVRLVRGAQASKAPIQRTADAVAGVFAPLVMALSVATLVVWLGVSAAGAVAPPAGESDFVFALKFAVAVIVVACPCGAFMLQQFNRHACAVLSLPLPSPPPHSVLFQCLAALGLATPTAIMVGTGVAAQHGVLIRSGGALELAHKMDAIVFDKTGTLTEGRPTVRGFHVER